jgi:transglutaminase-like putative cysteine protease
MFLEIEHRLSFSYDAFIRESFLELRMQPKTTPRQALQSFVLAVGPPTKVSRYRDWNGNVVHHFTIVNYHNRIEVSARSLVSTEGVGGGLAAAIDTKSLPGPPHPLLDFMEFGGPVRNSAALRKFAQGVTISPTATLGEQVAAFGRHIHERFAYRKNVTRYDSNTDDFLEVGAGVCQDFTHLMLAVARLRRIPCRYVSGYLHVEPEKGEAAQSHAWIEFYSATAGWIAFDPTHNREIDERYVIVGHGRHYDDVPPNKGIYRGNADEVLEARVLTRPSAPKAISALNEELEHIDLPVFPEIPERRRDRSIILVDDDVSQQQQQQQQAGSARSPRVLESRALDRWAFLGYTCPGRVSADGFRACPPGCVSVRAVDRCPLTC